MNFKLDEKFGKRALEIFRARGHDAQTVVDENLSGCADSRLFEICPDEQCCLVTLDLDFSDVTRYPPQVINGIVVIRVPRNPSTVPLEKPVRQFLNELKQTDLNRNPWIVEVGRIRVHEFDED